MRPEGRTHRLRYVGELTMPLLMEHLQNVVFITNENGEPEGTGFLVCMREEGDPQGYVVTAAHVVRDDPSILSVRAHTTDWDLIDLPAPDWVFHDSLDIAVAPIHEGKARLRAFSMATMTTDAADIIPKLGADVYYVGLFAPIPAMAERCIPMVRSGTLGALYVPGIQRDEDDEPFTAHLVDCRSYDGFSGSPVLIEMAYPGPRSPSEPIPPIFERYPDKAAQLGTLHYQTLLWGIFVAHFNEPSSYRKSATGVGVVLPIENVREVLMKEELVAMRKERDKRKRDQEPRIESTSARSEPNSYRRKDFLADLEKVTKKQPDPEA